MPLARFQIPLKTKDQTKTYSIFNTTPSSSVSSQGQAGKTTAPLTTPFSREGDHTQTSGHPEHGCTWHASFLSPATTWEEKPGPRPAGLTHAHLTHLPRIYPLHLHPTPQIKSLCCLTAQTTAMPITDHVADQNQAGVASDCDCLRPPRWQGARCLHAGQVLPLGPHAGGRTCLSTEPGSALGLTVP